MNKMVIAKLIKGATTIMKTTKIFVTIKTFIFINWFSDISTEDLEK